MLRKILLLALVPIASGSLARGQGAVREADSLQTVWLGSRINGQALIRVRGSWGTTYLVEPHISGQTLTFAEAEPAAISSFPAPLRLDAIDRIQVRGNAAGTGALIGACIGLAGGLAAGIGLTASLCNDGLGCSNAGGGTALLAVASTAGGALIGALVGATIKKWRTVYRAP